MKNKYPIVRKLVDGDLHLWHIDTTRHFALDPIHQWLTEEERQRASRFIFEKHQQRYATCRKLSKLILASYLRCQVEDIVFETSDFGKPYIAGRPIEFNISHSHDYLFLGVHLSHEVGVDIEQIKPRDFVGLARHSFSKQEVEAVCQASEQDREQVFYRIWCQKEAFIKLDGRGLRYPLKDFCVSTTAQGGLLSCKSEKLKDVYLRYYQSAPNIYAAFCIDQPDITPCFYDETFLNLTMSH